MIENITSFAVFLANFICVFLAGCAMAYLIASIMPLVIRTYFIPRLKGINAVSLLMALVILNYLLTIVVITTISAARMISDDVLNELIVLAIPLGVFFTAWMDGPSKSKNKKEC